MLCDHQIPSLQHEGTVQRISAEHVCSVRSLSLWCCMKQKNNTIPFSNCSMQHLLLFIASHVCSRNHAVDDFVLRRSLASRSVEQMASNPGWNRSSMINHTFFFNCISLSLPVWTWHLSPLYKVPRMESMILRRVTKVTKPQTETGP